MGTVNANESAVRIATTRITEAIDLAAQGLPEDVFYTVLENATAHCLMRAGLRKNRSWVLEWNSKAR
jgi:hypothetical protein